MKSQTELLDELIEKQCYIIDYLPERVLPNTDGHFFDVEYYLLNSYSVSNVRIKQRKPK